MRLTIIVMGLALFSVLANEPPLIDPLSKPTTETVDPDEIVKRDDKFNASLKQQSTEWKNAGEDRRKDLKREYVRSLTDILFKKEKDSIIDTRVAKIGEAVRKLHKGTKGLNKEQKHTMGRKALKEYKKNLAPALAKLVFPLFESRSSNELTSILREAREAAVRTEHLKTKSMGYLNEYYFAEVLRCSAQTLLDLQDGLTDEEITAIFFGKARFHLASVDAAENRNTHAYTQAEQTARAPQEYEYLRAFLKLYRESR